MDAEHCAFYEPPAQPDFGRESSGLGYVWDNSLRDSHESTTDKMHAVRGNVFHCRTERKTRGMSVVR